MGEANLERYKIGHEPGETAAGESAPIKEDVASSETSAPSTGAAPATSPTARWADQAWQIIVVKPRVDATSQPDLVDEIKRLRAAGQRKVALNLRQNRFLSFPAIRFCVETAREMRDAGGLFALVSCSEKTKRHFEIYGTLNPIQIVRDEGDLLTLRLRDFDL